MASVTVTAISNNGSVKEYATKLEKCLQAVSHQRMAPPKHFSTYIRIIANIIFELETSTICVGIRKEAPIGTISIDPGNNSDPRNMIWLVELLANQQVAICLNKTGNGKKARAYKRRPEGPQLSALIPHITNIETSYNYFSQSEST